MKPLLVNASGEAIAFDKSKDAVLEELLVDAFGIVTGLVAKGATHPAQLESLMNEARATFMNAVVELEGLRAAIEARYGVKLTARPQAPAAPPVPLVGQGPRVPTVEEEAAAFVCSGCDENLLACTCPDIEIRLTQAAAAGGPNAHVFARILKERLTRSGKTVES